MTQNSKQKNIWSTAIMCIAFGGIMAVTNSTLYWWVQIVGVIALILGIIAALVGIAELYSQHKKPMVK